MSESLESFVQGLSQDELRTPRQSARLVQGWADRHGVEYAEIRDKFQALAAVELERREEVARDRREFKFGRWPLTLDLALRA